MPERRQADADKKEIMDAFEKALPGIIAAALEHHSLTCPIRQIIPATEANTKGVNNFNMFRLDMTKKIAFVHGAAWAWTIILGGLLVFAGWSFRQVYPALRLIMADYYHNHPDAQMDHQKILSASSDEVFTVHMDHHPQQAKEQ